MCAGPASAGCRHLTEPAVRYAHGERLEIPDSCQFVRVSARNRNANAHGDAIANHFPIAMAAM